MLPIPNLSLTGGAGGAAGPSSAGGFFGSINFEDGAFLVGGAGNTADNPENAAQTPGGSPGGFSWPIIAALAVGAYFLLKAHS